MNMYDAGNMVTITTTFTNASGVAVNPSSVTLRVMDPNNIETDYMLGTLTNPTTGVFSQNVTVLTSGIWRYRWEATGTLVAASDSSFIVSATPFSNPQ